MAELQQKNNEFKEAFTLLLSIFFMCHNKKKYTTKTTK